METVIVASMPGETAVKSSLPPLVKLPPQHNQHTQQHATANEPKSSRHQMTFEALAHTAPTSPAELYRVLVDRVNTLRVELSDTERAFYAGQSPDAYLRESAALFTQIMSSFRLAEINRLDQIQRMIAIARDSEPGQRRISEQLTDQLVTYQNRLLNFCPGKFSHHLETANALLTYCEKYLRSQFDSLHDNSGSAAGFGAANDDSLDTVKLYSNNILEWRDSISKCIGAVYTMPRQFMSGPNGLTLVDLPQGAVELLEIHQMLSCSLLAMFPGSMLCLRAICDLVVNWVHFDQNYAGWLRRDMANVAEERLRAERDLKHAKHASYMSLFRLKQLQSERGKLVVEVDSSADRQSDVVVQEEALVQQINATRIDIEMKQHRMLDMKQRQQKLAAKVKRAAEKRRMAQAQRDQQRAQNATGDAAAENDDEEANEAIENAVTSDKQQHAEKHLNNQQNAPPSKFQPRKTSKKPTAATKTNAKSVRIAAMTQEKEKTHKKANEHAQTTTDTAPQTQTVVLDVTGNAKAVEQGEAAAAGGQDNDEEEGGTDINSQIASLRRQRRMSTKSARRRQAAELTKLTLDIKLIKESVGRLERRLPELTRQRDGCRAKLTYLESRKSELVASQRGIAELEHDAAQQKRDVINLQRQLDLLQSQSDRLRELVLIKTSSEILHRIFFNMPFGRSGVTTKSKQSSSYSNDPAGALDSASNPSKHLGSNNALASHSSSSFSSLAVPHANTTKTNMNDSSTFYLVMRMISRHIGHDWPDLYRSLPFHPVRGREIVDNDIGEFASQLTSEEKTCRLAFKKWLRYHLRARLQDLLDACTAIGRADIVRKIERRLDIITNSSGGDESGGRRHGNFSWPDLASVDVPDFVPENLVPFYREVEVFDRIRQLQKNSAAKLPASTSS